MCVSRNHRFSVFLRFLQHCGNKVTQTLPHRHELFSQIEPDCRVRLIVPASPHVKLSPYSTAKFYQSGFHIHMDIFERYFRNEFPPFYLIGYNEKVFLYRRCLPIRKQADLSEHSRMGDASSDVRKSHHPVQIKRLCKFLDRFVRVLRKTSLPHLYIPSFCHNSLCNEKLILVCHGAL